MNPKCAIGCSAVPRASTPWWVAGSPSMSRIPLSVVRGDCLRYLHGDACRGRSPARRGPPGPSPGGWNGSPSSVPAITATTRSSRTKVMERLAEDLAIALSVAGGPSRAIHDDARAEAWKGRQHDRPGDRCRGAIAKLRRAALQSGLAATGSSMLASSARMAAPHWSRRPCRPVVSRASRRSAPSRPTALARDPPRDERRGERERGAGGREGGDQLDAERAGASSAVRGELVLCNHIHSPTATYAQSAATAVVPTDLV